MPKAFRAGLFALAAALPCLYCLYFSGLADTGLLGPDEPRYAAIGREMARSGDWVTPRLWGEAWFEKPALLYWMTAAGTLAGLGPELAPRLPVALLSAAFLALFFLVLRREFGPRAGFFSSAILATSAGWTAFSQVGVTDLPLAVCFGASMLLSASWLRSDSPRTLLFAGALLGLAVLAKGLVPVVLAAPLVWFGRKRWRQWPLYAAGCVAAAAPWYALVWMRNGSAFFEDFIWKHHVERFASEALAHPQPFWFFLPVLLAGMFPWTPLLALLARPSLYAGAQRAFLGATLAFGLVFFSASTNKLPGYLLPLLPAAAALAGLALAEVRNARLPLAAGAGLLVLLPPIAMLLPKAIESGLTRARFDPGALVYGLPVAALAAGVYVLEARGRRPWAVGLLAAAIALSVAVVKARTWPALDERVSARGLWREIAADADRACVEDLHRSWRYGLNYYSVEPLPDCAAAPRPVIVRQTPGERPVVERALTPP